MVTKSSEPMSAARRKEMVLLVLNGLAPKSEGEMRFLRLAKQFAQQLAGELGCAKSKHSITTSGALGVVVLRIGDRCYIALGRYADQAGTDDQANPRDYFCYSRCDVVERTAVHWAALLSDYTGVIARLRQLAGS
jgi:hypothetical protein